MRHTHAASEKQFVDFDGLAEEAREAKTVVASLGASNYTYAESRFSEALHDWIGVHVNTLAFLGRMPKVIVCEWSTTAISADEPVAREELACH